MSDTMNFGVDLLPITTETYNLGSSDKKWNIYGSLTGNASTATTATNLDAAPTLVQTGTSTISLSPNTNYTLTVGGKSVIFKTPNDTKVTQSNKAYSSYTYWRPLVIGARNASTASGLTNTATDTTDLVYTFSNIIAQPSTGTIKATTFDGNATTATKWASAQTAYVNLGNASTTTSIQGGSSNAAILGVNGVLGTANGGTGFSSTVYVNSVVIGNSTTATDALQTIRTGNGAFYATEEDGVPDFGTLPVAQGGTGRTSFTANEVIMSGSTTTSALTTRSITNNTSATAITASTNIITANTLYYHTGNSNLTTVGTITTGTWNATTIGAGYGGTGQSTYTVGDILYCGTANTLSKLSGNTTTTRKFLRSVATTSGTAVAPAWDTVTKTDVGLGNVTNDAQVKASLGTAKGDMLYWSASATPARLAIGTAGYFLKATADGPVWANTTDITALGTVTTGTWNATTIDVQHGGTGATSFTANCAIISGSTTTSALTTRAITDITTAGTNPTSNTNLITANTLMNYHGTTNISTVGTITSGTWNGSKIDVSYLSSSTPNRLVWSQSTGTLVAGYHYVSGTQMSIGTTGAPDTGYALKVNGALETANLINIITNSRTKDIYFSNGTPGSCSNVGRIMYDINSATGITKSQFGFIEYSYPSTAGASASAYSENYYLPSANAGLGASVAYNILTDKAVTPFPIVGRQLPSSATLDTLTTPGVYAINNNLASGATFPSSQTHAKYGTLLHVAGLTASTGAYNNAIQLWLSGITNSSNYRLFIRGHYYNSSNTWEGWTQIPLNIPNPPTTAGTYKLKVTVTNSVASYSWVSG